MKTINIIRLLINKMITFYIMAFAIVSCDTFVDVDLPESQLTGVTVFEDEATADAAMANIYANIRDNGLLTGTQYGLSHNLGIYTDELKFYGDTSFSSFYFYNNTLLPSNSLIATYWNSTYNQIYAANALHEGVNGSSYISQEISDRLQGETLFVRALLHFYLANLYGDIPYITSTDYTENSVVSRMPIPDVYTYIISDLEQAINLLPENYYTASRARPNKYTAIALMARVYLYLESWTNAENLANLILNNAAMYTIEDNPELVFLSDSSETIWQLPPAIEGHATSEATTFTLFSGPPSLSSISEPLISSFSENDLRRILWIGEVSDGTNTWYYPKKYKQTGVEAISTEYSIIFRLSELYLIRAEARARNGNLNGAKEDLNQIRLRAGLTEASTTGQQQIIEAILNERKLELFTELGHRFFDLKRNNKLDEVLIPIKPAWNTDDKLFPIPEIELSLNPNLKPQNIGY